MKAAFIWFVMLAIAGPICFPVSGQPAFEHLAFTDTETYASGLVTNALELGGPQPPLFTSLAISASRQWMSWNLTESNYYLTATGAYITITSLPGICFLVPNFTFADEGANWSSLRHTLDVKMEGVSGPKSRYFYSGIVQSDVGSCCDVVGGGVFTDDNNRIHELTSAQMFPAFGGPGIPTRSTIVNTRLSHTYFRAARDSDFVLPPECASPVADFCATFYKSYDFCVNNTAVPLEFTTSHASARRGVLLTVDGVRYRGMTLNGVEVAPVA